jgi:hypothetical protein
MKMVAWISLTSVACWLAAVALLRGAMALELLLGMIGPLAAVAVSWVVTEAAFKRNPATVTSTMTLAFGAKMVFFAAYVTGAIGVLRVQPQPFVISFVCYFVTLYIAEAVLLRRLFAEHRPAS